MHVVDEIYSRNLSLNDSSQMNGQLDRHFTIEEDVGALK